MSRCFPFPPPGYERKHRPEEIDLLKEAKRKEKKHKKDRSKDKEKGEKDGSDEKHRDKKDRKGKHKDKKEKHRDKKKDKEDRGKDKDKSSISEESTVAGTLGEKGHESLRPKGESKDRSCIVDEGKVSAPFPGQNGGRPFQNSQSSLENKESKFLQELDRRIRADETNRASSQLPEGLAGLDNRGQETASRSAAKNSSGILAEEKMGYNKDKRVDTRKMDAQGVRNEVGGNSTIQNFATFAKSKVDGIPRLEEENIDSWWEDKEKSKEIGDNKQRDKHKDRDKDGKRVEKEKDRKKKKKEDKKNKEKVKVEKESKKTGEEKSRDLANIDLVGVTSNKGTDFLKDVKNSIITDRSIKKRNDMATNGFFLENETRPIKMPRLTSHRSTENGRKLEAYRTPSASASDKHVVPNSVLQDKGERLINGMIAQKSSSSKPITSSTMISDQLDEGSKVSLHKSSYSNKAPPEPKMEDPIAEATRRPPHPDSKYLNEVLTVPKLGDWCETDDQDWLFSKQPPLTRMKSESVLVKEQHVWSEAVVMKSADVCAMPYVIPY